jgi:hypothetical protein
VQGTARNMGSSSGPKAAANEKAAKVHILCVLSLFFFLLSAPKAAKRLAKVQILCSLKRKFRFCVL